MKALISLVLVLFISGCASTTGVRVVKSDIGKTPGDELIHKISAGEVLYSKYNYKSSPTAKISGKFSIGVLDEGSSKSELILTKLKNKEAYCGEFIRYTPGYSKPWHGCFVDKENDGYFEELIYSGASTSINDKPKYTKEKNIIEGFKQEILFQGRTEKTLKFKYREFSKSMARPAFTQDIEYFISKNGTTSGSFKGLKIEILSVNGNYINYRVKGDIGI